MTRCAAAVATVCSVSTEADNAGLPFEIEYLMHGKAGDDVVRPPPMAELCRVPPDELDFVTRGEVPAAERNTCPSVLSLLRSSRRRRQHANAAKTIENGLHLRDFGRRRYARS